jgi:catechol 2,3-dioxygenase-like lactoylglutathione lyase family enzyme
MMAPKGKKMQACLGHVGIEVSDLKKSSKFYEALSEALSLKRLYESKETIGWGNKEFEIWIAVSETPRIKRKPPTGEEMVVSEHLAIYLTDKKLVDAADEVMKKRGFSPLFPPEEHPKFSPGYYSASYCDPDNYVIEIYTLPEQ